MIIKEYKCDAFIITVEQIENNPEGIVKITENVADEIVYVGIFNDVTSALLKVADILLQWNEAFINER